MFRHCPLPCIVVTKGLNLVTGSEESAFSFVNSHVRNSALLTAHSDQIGHLFQSISDTDSDGYRTVLGAKRRSGFRHKKVSDMSQGPTTNLAAPRNPAGVTAPPANHSVHRAVYSCGRASGGNELWSHRSRCRRSLRVTDSPRPHE